MFPADAAVVTTDENTAGVSEGLTLTCNRTRWAGVVRRTTTLALDDVTFPLHTPLAKGDGVWPYERATEQNKPRRRKERNNIGDGGWCELMLNPP